MSFRPYSDIFRRREDYQHGGIQACGTSRSRRQTSRLEISWPDGSGQWVEEEAKMRLENLMLGAWRSQTHAIATRRPRGGRGFWGRTRVCSSKRGEYPSSSDSNPSSYLTYCTLKQYPRRPLCRLMRFCLRSCTPCFNSFPTRQEDKPPCIRCCWFADYGR
jgi:hypothetical protein